MEIQVVISGYCLLEFRDKFVDSVFIAIIYLIESSLLVMYGLFLLLLVSIYSSQSHKDPALIFEGILFLTGAVLLSFELQELLTIITSMVIK